jgi:hypothetical protein
MYESEEALASLCGILAGAGVGAGGVESCVARTRADSAAFAQAEYAVSVHVRLGDRLIHDPALHAWPWYAERLGALHATGLPLGTLVVASDDAPSLELAATPPGAGGVSRVIVVPAGVRMPSESSGTPMAHYLQGASADVRRQGGVDVLLAMAMMARANVFVGLCMSQFGRFTASLVLARGRTVHPPISPDRDFCMGPVGHYTPVLEGWVARRRQLVEGAAGGYFRF